MADADEADRAFKREETIRAHLIHECGVAPDWDKLWDAVAGLERGYYGDAWDWRPPDRERVGGRIFRDYDQYCELEANR